MLSPRPAQYVYLLVSSEDKEDFDPNVSDSFLESYDVIGVCSSFEVALARASLDNYEADPQRGITKTEFIPYPPSPTVTSVSSGIYGYPMWAIGEARWYDEAGNQDITHYYGILRIPILTEANRGVEWDTENELRAHGWRYLDDFESQVTITQHPMR